MSKFAWLKELADEMRAAGVAKFQHSADGESVSVELSDGAIVSEFRLPEHDTEPPPRNELSEEELRTMRKRAIYEDIFGHPMSDEELAGLPDDPGVLPN